MSRFFNKRSAGKVIIELLNSNPEITCPVYYKEAKSKDIYPYAVFHLSSAFMGESVKSNVTMEVNIWDNKGDNIVDLMIIRDAIIKALDRKLCRASGFNMVFDIEGNLEPEDPEDKIRRELLTFGVRYFSKEV